MNKGLKENTTQLTLNVGSLTSYINLSNIDSNLIFTIPLLSTLGLNSFELSLIFNYQNKNVISIFGKAIKLNYYSKITVNDDLIELENADGFTYEFIKTSETVFSNLELNSKIEVLENNAYKLSDKYGNYKLYNETNLEYPYLIKLVSRLELHLDFLSDIKTISNSKGDIVKFHLTNNLVDSIIYEKYEEILYLLRVEYTEKNEIKLIDLIKEGKTISSYMFEYETQYIIVKDVISNYKIKFSLQNNRVVSLVDSYEDSFDETRKTKIEYSEFVTKVTAYLGNSNYYFFNSSGLLDFKLDPNFYATSYEYNNLNNLTHTSSMLNLKNINNLLPKYDISNFIIDGNIEIEEVSIKDFLFCELFKDKIHKISGSGKLSLNIPYNGIADEPYVLSFFAKSNNNTDLEVILKLDNKTNKTFKLSNNFSLFTLGTLTQKSFKTIGLELNISSADIEIGRVELLQKDFGSYFEYDENKNLVSIFNKAGYSKLNYESNIVSSASLSDTKSYYKYDKLGNLIETDTTYSRVNKNTYDTNNLLTSSESLNSNIKFIKTYKYNLEGNLIESKEEGAQTKYSYDTFKRVINMTDSLNNILNYNYDEFDNIRQIILSKNNNYIHSKYKYDTQNRLETITISNGDYYDFYYNNSNNLINIKLNEVTLLKYSYYSNNKLESIEYPNFDKYKFIYDDKEKFTKIYYIKNNKETLKYECIYNEFNELESIKDSSYIIKTYKYDLDSRISEEKSNNLKLNYKYNNLDNVILKKKEIKDNIFFETLDNIDKSLGVNPDSILDDLLVSNNVYIASFSKDLSLNNKEINSSAKLKLTKDGIIPCIEISSEEDKLLSYRLTDKGFDMTSGSISLWFKPSDINTKQYLFSQRTETGFGQINLYIKEERLNLEIINQDNKKFLIIRTKKEINQDSWNFFSLDFVYRCDTGLRKDYIFEVNLNLNGKTYKYISHNQDLYFDSLNPTIYIGYNSNGKTNTNFFNGKIALLLLGKNRYVSPDKLTKFYRITKDYIIENEVKDDVCALNYSLNSIYKIDKDILNKFDIFPLSNSVYSLNGTKPISFDIRNVSSLDKNRTFTFNKYIKEYAFQADSNKLEYDFNISSCGSIYMSIYTDILCDYQYIFESVDRNNHNISLYLKDSYLYININGTILETYINVDLNMWHDIGFSFMCLSNSLKYNIYVDNVSYEDNINLNFIYSNLTFSIGRTIEDKTINSNLGIYLTSFPLNGQIRNLCVSNTFSNEDIFNSLINNLNHTTHISLFDEFNRIKKSEIKEKNKTILSNIYSYRLIDNMYSSYLIDSETIKYGTTSNKREYYYDSLGNLVKINDSLFESHNYAYDYRGYLIKEDNINYTYDQNGNILTAGSDTFTYDTLIKDRLIKFNDKDILYLNNTLYKYDKKEFKFETNKLISVLEEYIDGGRDISFTYNLEGLIETKTDLTYFNDDQSDIEVKTNYYYEKNNLISLISDKYRFDFLYDGYNKLYGFILNNEIKYYYIRDNLCNILGIIDEKFNLIVRYVYDAFGNILHVIDTSQNNIGTINPFRFKGYFYDNDLKMYYLKSRFYIPLWRRFLTEDNINYLDIYCVNNINLYSYARNNPVKYIDPFGNFAISSLVAGALIGATIGFSASLLKDYLNDDSIFNGDVSLWEYLGSTTSGLVGGIFGEMNNVLVRILGSVTTEIIGSMISENVNYSIISFKRDIFNGLLSAGISESISILGKRVGKHLLKTCYSSASKNGKKQIYRYIKSQCKYSVTNQSALNALNFVNNYIYFYKTLEKISEYSYSFTAVACGNFIEW